MRVFVAGKIRATRSRNNSTQLFLGYYTPPFFELQNSRMTQDIFCYYE
jgi:hypothetical protein